MEPRYFEEGNFIYECKSSPEQADGPVNQRSLQNCIGDVKKLLKRKQPTGFRYIFPVNRLDNNNENILCYAVIKKYIWFTDRPGSLLLPGLRSD